jgi:hypothetical protein
MWEDEEVQAMLKEFDMKVARCDGCSLGVVAKRKSAEGRPMQKAWDIATTNETLFEEINTHRCVGPECKSLHVPVQGSDTNHTGNYPGMLCDIIHNSYAVNQELKEARAAPAALAPANADPGAQPSDTDPPTLIQEPPVPPPPPPDNPPANPDDERYGPFQQDEEPDMFSDASVWLCPGTQR